MCFKTRRASTSNFTVTINLDFNKWDFFWHFSNTTNLNIRVSIPEIIN